MSQGQKLFVLSVCFIFMALILSTPLSDISRFGRSYNDLSDNGHVISARELNDFLGVWKKLVQDNVANYNNLQLSFSESSNAIDSLPSSLLRWLRAQGWSAERFFYDEQKVRELANIVSLQNSIAANRRLADSVAGSGMKAILQEQEAQLKGLAADPRELETVAASITEINEILNLFSSPKSRH